MTDNVINLAAIRARRATDAKARDAAAKPTWGDDIITLALYVQLVKAEHAAESARIRFEQKRDGITDAWWDGPEDIKERVHANNRQWDLYIGLCAHLATLPAQTRNEARVKRDTIGKAWFSPDSCVGRDPKPGTLGESFAKMRSGCLADDHLFPPSMKLARR